MNDNRCESCKQAAINNIGRMVPAPFWLAIVNKKCELTGRLAWYSDWRPPQGGGIKSGIKIRVFDLLFCFVKQSFKTLLKETKNYYLREYFQQRYCCFPQSVLKWCLLSLGGVSSASRMNWLIDRTFSASDDVLHLDWELVWFFEWRWLPWLHGWTSCRRCIRWWIPSLIDRDDCWQRVSKTQWILLSTVDLLPCPSSCNRSSSK